ncbi:MAG: SUMF1/EgtB/PvdO family nonheme iron enzyme [Bacteroidia bacterium]|nr:SUMF1/EgtB/PvdO family nonheme iron enzyme [Bacteroidia bacterium]
MKTTVYVFSVIMLLAGTVFLFSSCQKHTSSSTGWEYSQPDNGGFEYVDYVEQETGPGLVLIEGGTFHQGRIEQDVVYDWNNFPRRITVSSFYMDETEITNVNYREYLYWLRRIFIDYIDVYKQALPDTMVWLSKLGFNDPYVELYFRHPAYQEYPVVGVNWIKAKDFCSWRTDRVNEMIMVREGLLYLDPNQQGEENFNTNAYLAGQYEGMVRDPYPSLNPNADYRKIMLEDGILLPQYRLPTEGEWEFAALANIGNTYVPERIYHQRLYPWDGHYIRNDGERSSQGDLGKIMANSMRGRGDNMGTAGYLNDNADITSPVTSYWPNDYGLYCMSGNVNEWVMDVYRPLMFEDMDEFRPYRGNIYQTWERDASGAIVEKDSLGRIPMREITDEEAFNRRNFNRADNVNFLDGDRSSSIYFNETEDTDDPKSSHRMYDQGKMDPGKVRGGREMTSLINNRARIYKGGSWRDRVYWMVAGTRRFLDEEQARDDLGFRCAMTRVGSPVGMGGN